MRSLLWLLFRSKLSQCRVKLQSNIHLKCEPISLSLVDETNHLVEHIHQLKYIHVERLSFIVFVFIVNSSFVPPKSTTDNARHWYEQGYSIVDAIVNKRQQLIDQIQQVVQNDIDTLKNESRIIYVKYFSINHRIC
jgi:hypothetical protein